MICSLCTEDYDPSREEHTMSLKGNGAVKCGPTRMSSADREDSDGESLPGSSIFVPALSDVPPSTPQSFLLHTPRTTTTLSTCSPCHSSHSSPTCSSSSRLAPSHRGAGIRRRRALRMREEALQCAETIWRYQFRRLASLATIDASRARPEDS